MLTNGFRGVSIDGYRTPYPSGRTAYASNAQSTLYRADSTPVPQVNLPAVTKVESLTPNESGSESAAADTVNNNAEPLIAHGDKTPPVTPESKE